MMDNTIDEKLEKQIRGAIRRWEKKENIYPPSYYAKEQNYSDGKKTETRFFEICIHFSVPSSYRTGGSIIYHVHDKRTDTLYSARHYFPNTQFNATYAWYIEVIEDENYKPEKEEADEE